MNIFHPYNNKERLFEVFYKVNKIKLNEEKLSIPQKENIIKLFINFVNTKLNINEFLPEIIITFNENEDREMKSFGGYSPDNNFIKISGHNRNLADILRTLGHELVHCKQNKEGKLNQNSGITGSDEENEANSLAGVFLREFGKKYPIIYE